MAVGLRALLETAGPSFEKENLSPRADAFKGLLYPKEPFLFVADHVLRRDFKTK